MADAGSEHGRPTDMSLDDEGSAVTTGKSDGTIELVRVEVPASLEAKEEESPAIGGVLFAVADGSRNDEEE